MGSCLSACCMEAYDTACCMLCCGRGSGGIFSPSLPSSNLYYCPSCLTPFFARLAATRVNRDIPDKIKYILTEEREALKRGEGIEDPLCSHSWNDKDKSPCVRVENMGGLVKIERSRNFECSVVRGKIGYTRGVHMWQIHWPRRDRDKYSAIGVATQDASLFEEIGNNNNKNSSPSALAFPPLPLPSFSLGKTRGNKNTKTLTAAANNSNIATSFSATPAAAAAATTAAAVSSSSWGWNLYSNELSPCKKKYFPSLHENDDSFSPLTPTKFQLILDLEEKTLAFMAYGKYLGVAFKDLNYNNKPLYLALSGREIVSGVSVKYLSKYPRF